MAGGFIVREFRKVLPPTLLFLGGFNLLVLTLGLLETGTPGNPAHYATATVLALVCGKAVPIADMLPFFNRFPGQPLIWNVLW
jgi:hypothetical protein